MKAMNHGFYTRAEIIGDDDYYAEYNGILVYGVIRRTADSNPTKLMDVSYGKSNKYQYENSPSMHRRPLFLVEGDKFTRMEKINP